MLFARCTGRCSVETNTTQPSRIRSVHAAAYVIASSGLSCGDGAEHVLLRPGALEPQLLDASEVITELHRIEFTIGVELRDRDREAHTRHRSPVSSSPVMRLAQAWQDSGRPPL